MKYACIAIALLWVLLPVHSVRAQQPATPEPTVDISIDPPRVVVGQKALLRVEVLAPNYMTAPPELPDFQVRNAVTRQLQSVNINEQKDDTTFAGVRFEFAIYPQESGSYAIANQEVTVRYAAEPPVVREMTIALPRVTFEAFVPDAAVDLRPFLAANRLTIEQTVQRSSDQLKTGDAVTRTVMIKAEGTPAMLLPPQDFVSIDGLALYPTQPVLQDKTDQRADVLTATRVDSATYMLQRPGDFLLPAIDIKWWNVGAGKVELAHLDAVPLQVAANPIMQGAIVTGTGNARWNWSAVRDGIAEHWLLAVLIGVVLAAITWFAPLAVRSVATAYRQRRSVYLQSEAWSFRRLRRAASAGDARTVYFAMLGWLQRFEPVAPDRTIKAFKVSAADPALDSEIGLIEQRLFASPRDAGKWSSRRFLSRVSTARRNLLRPAASHDASRQLPQQINPMDVPEAPTKIWRKPAR